MTDKQNISIITKAKLCNSCGGCKGVCPSEAIEFEETVGGNLFPNVNIEKCVDCGLCYKICQGKGLCNTLLEEMSEKKDPFSGTSIKTYLGKANHNDIYTNSQSGGALTGLLLSLINSKEIKGAIIVKMDSGQPPRPSAILATTKQEIINAQKSKYVPVPLLSIVQKIKNLDYPVAIVGLPCHIHGLYKIFEFFPELTNKIKYRFGLICAGTMVYSSMDYLLYKAKKSYKNKWNLIFRDKLSGGYPGNIKISINGKNYILDYKHRREIHNYFVLARCRICFDKMNIFSDITFGDPWGIDYADHQNGESICVVRNNNGLEAIQNAINNNSLELKEIKYHEVLNGQKIERKKRDWSGYIKEWKSRDTLTPNYYNILIKKTDLNNNKIRYKKNIDFSLSIDSFTNKSKIIKHTDLKIKTKKVKKYLFYPFKIVKKLVLLKK